MGYVDTNTILNPSPGVPLPAALLDQYRDNFEWIVRGKPRCRTRLGTVQSIPDSTTTSLVMDVEDYDIGGMHSTSSNPSYHTAVESGFWRFTFYPVYAANATGIRRALVKVNGVSVVADASTNAVTSGKTIFSLGGALFLSAGDNVEPQLYQEASGSAVDCLGAAFEMVLEAKV